MSATAIFSLAAMPNAGGRVERRARVAPGFAAHLVVIADDPIDLGHISEHPGLRLRRAAGDDNARIRPLALQPADRLPRLRHGLVGDRAAIDDDGVGEPRALRLAGDHLGFEGIEAAAEGDDVNAHDLSDGRKQRGIEAAFIFEISRARHQHVVIALAPFDRRVRHRAARSAPGDRRAAAAPRPPRSRRPPSHRPWSAPRHAPRCGS